VALPVAHVRMLSVLRVAPQHNRPACAGKGCTVFARQVS
jgi:hypothetical protein